MDSPFRDTMAQAAAATQAPFALLAGPAMADDAVAALMRRMGLQPEASGAGALPLRLALGPLTATLDRAGVMPLDFADPADRATSSLGISMPGDWRTTGTCWVVELGGADAVADAPSPPLADYLKLLVLLIDAFDAAQIFWSPARLWTGAPQFRGAIAEMQASGMPPVLHLVAFRRRDDAAGERVATRGLVAFAGQELEARIPPGWDMAAMVKRLARLALDMMLNGPVARAQQAPGLERGETVALIPQAAGGGRPATVLVEFSADR
ncbi:MULTISPECIES: hypothetical protein [unclassified Sphingopyxis]|uniref:hypothetical protein n=1 Tax=unclassified Sphingopyxis TaxID=2614943 RepID=UPI000736ED79|nr:MULTISPECIES: hypothetical protein [unclassified Sphingopyxis]KTE38060.1 hypothetical protein ATE62_11990 [Sphingopyxis sp. HIX]KTE84630.1 hypothetical protein ATE72_07760 [Sphingopyxis sp. HXXIV]